MLVLDPLSSRSIDSKLLDGVDLWLIFVLVHAIFAYFVSSTD